MGFLPKSRNAWLDFVPLSSNLTKVNVTFPLFSATDRKTVKWL